MIPKSPVMIPAIRMTRKIEKWMPPVPTGIPIPPKLRLGFGTAATGQFCTLKCGFGHFWPANCAEANQPAE